PSLAPATRGQIRVGDALERVVVMRLPGVVVFHLTLHPPYRATGSRFLPAGFPASPRRRCLRHWMLRAAFRSRSRMRPQFVQTRVRTESDLAMRSPQPEQSCDVYAGGTACTCLPAHAALKARMVRKWRHPAS